MPIVVALVLTSFVCARADEWRAPRVQNVFSANGQYFVRVTPGTAVNDPALQTRARGEFYRRQADRSYRLVANVQLQNRVSPAYAVVTDDGYLVTFDEWFQIGKGNVIAFYRPTGALIRAVAIEELYTPDRLIEIPQSISSRWWRCGVFYTPPTGANDQTLTVFEHFGGSFALHPGTGAFDYRAGTAVCPLGGAKTF